MVAIGEPIAKPVLLSVETFSRLEVDVAKSARAQTLYTQTTFTLDF